MEKPKNNGLQGDPEFAVREAEDSAAADFLRSQEDRPGDPEWHLKNMKKSPDQHTISMVQIDLDDEPTVEKAEKVGSPDTGAPTDSRPEPVDLTLEEPPRTAGPDELEVRKSATRAKPDPLQSPVPKNESVPPGFSPSEETAYEKDLRQAGAGISPERGREIPVDIDQGKVSDPTEPAIFDGKSLRFPGGALFSTGDIVVCENRRYRIKRQTDHPRIFYMKAVGLLVLVLLAATGFSSLFSAAPTGSLTGVAIDIETGKVAPGATVTLSNGSTTATDRIGLYSFAGLAPGDYIVQVTLSGYKIQTETITREEDRDVILPFALEPLFTAADREKEQQKEAKQAKNQVKAAVYGTLKLDIDFKDYIIYFNNKIIGKNIKKISEISPGKHRLALEKNQYEEYRIKVNIKAHRTTTVSIALGNLKRKTTPQQRAKTRFAEGKQALDNAHYTVAIDAFDAALAELPEYPEARQYRGWAFRKSGNKKAAAEDLKGAAELYALGNRYLEAVTCVNLLLEMNPEKGEFYLMRGDYHTALGELQSAIEDYKDAIDRNKKSLPFRLALAEGYFRNKQFKNAAKEFEKARKITADPTDVYVRLILSYLYAGKDKDLLKRYRELAGIASSEKMERLRNDPEWQRVLQLIGPDERYKKP